MQQDDFLKVDENLLTLRRVKEKNEWDEVLNEFPLKKYAAEEVVTKKVPTPKKTERKPKATKPKVEKPQETKVNSSAIDIDKDTALSAIEAMDSREQVKCEEILLKISEQIESEPFLVPVDPIALGVPTYFQVVKHPMDLGTIKSKLNGRKYSNVTQFRNDVLLTFNNAMLFNAVNSPVYDYAKKLREMFEKEVKEKKLLAQPPPNRRKDSRVKPLSKEEKIRLKDDIVRACKIKQKRLEIFKFLDLNASGENVEFTLESYSDTKLRELQKMVKGKGSFSMSDDKKKDTQKMIEKLASTKNATRSKQQRRNNDDDSSSSSSIDSEEQTKFNLLKG